MTQQVRKVYEKKPFYNSTSVEKCFSVRRMRALEGYKELQRLDGGGLAKLLLAGQINGFELLKYGTQVTAEIAKVKRRLQMLNAEESICLGELRAKGVTYA